MPRLAARGCVSIPPLRSSTGTSDQVSEVIANGTQTRWIFEKCSCRNISREILDFDREIEEVFLQEHCGKLSTNVLYFATYWNDPPLYPSLSPIPADILGSLAVIVPLITVLVRLHSTGDHVFRPFRAFSQLHTVDRRLAPWALFFLRFAAASICPSY